MPGEVDSHATGFRDMALYLVICGALSLCAGAIFTDLEALNFKVCTNFSKVVLLFSWSAWF